MWLYPYGWLGAWVYSSLGVWVIIMKCLALVHDKPLVALLKKFPVALPIHYGMLSPFRGFLYDEKLFILITVTGHYSESYKGYFSPRAGMYLADAISK